MEIYFQGIGPSESYISQISFEGATDGAIIFLFCIRQSVQGTFRIDRDQRVIIRFFLKEGSDAHRIIYRMQARFAKHFYQFETVQFWSTEAWLGLHDLHGRIRTGRPLCMMLMLKFWLPWIRVVLNEPG
jgi:hypothetical protein